MEVGFFVEHKSFQTIAYSGLKKQGFVPENGSEIFVKYLPKDLTVLDLIPHFRKVGELFQIRLMMAENLRENRGYAYVSYINPTTAKNAVRELKGKTLRGHQLSFESSLNNCRIFLGGIPIDKTKDEVWQMLMKKGVRQIVDVIMYRSYTKRDHNRGFVFVEFQTHEDAARFRAKYVNKLTLWNSSVVIDWSVPVPEVTEDVMNTVKIIFLRNLDVCQTRANLQSVMEQYVAPECLERVFKFKNYAFIHLKNRTVAELLFKKLLEYYQNTIVEVQWSKPPSKYTSPAYRHKKMATLASRCPRAKHNSVSSDFSSLGNYSPTENYAWSLSSEQNRDLNETLDFNRFPRYDDLRSTNLPRTSTPIDFNGHFGDINETSIVTSLQNSLSSLSLSGSPRIQDFSVLSNNVFENSLSRFEGRYVYGVDTPLTNSYINYSSTLCHPPQHYDTLANVVSQAGVLPRNLGGNVFDFIGDILS